MRRADTCSYPGCALPLLSDRAYCWIHNGVSERTVRRVWAALTNNPLALLRELVRASGLPRSTVYASLRELERRGILTREPHIARGRRLVEPFCHVDGAPVDWRKIKIRKRKRP